MIGSLSSALADQYRSITQARLVGRKELYPGNLSCAAVAVVPPDAATNSVVHSERSAGTNRPCH